MSYAQKKEISGNRTLALVFVIVIQFALGYAIVTGLAYNVIKQASEDLKTFDVEEEPPPPPEEPPPTPKDMPDVPPPPTMPPPVMRMNVTPPTIQQVEAPPPVYIPPVAPAPPPPPPPPRQSQPRSLTGEIQGLITGDDYPQSALNNNEQGAVQVTLTVGPTGRVTGCSASGSASSTLRNATCRLLSARAKFSPAQDGNGNGITSTYTRTIRWQIQE